MNKKKNLWIALDLVFIIVFNVIFFMYGNNMRTGAVWASYIFIHIAYIFVIVTPLLVCKGRDSSIFGMTMTSISTVYFWITFILGIIVFILRPITFRWVIAMNIILMGVYVATSIANMLANERSADETQRKEMEIQYVRGCSNKILNLIEITSDSKMKKKLQKVYDVIHSSQTASNSEAKKYEREVSMLLEDLEKSIEEINYEDAIQIADAVVRTANRRNQVV